MDFVQIIPLWLPLLVTNQCFSSKMRPWNLCFLASVVCFFSNMKFIWSSNDLVLSLSCFDYKHLISLKSLWRVLGISLHIVVLWKTKQNMYHHHSDHILTLSFSLGFCRCWFFVIPWVQHWSASIADRLVRDFGCSNLTKSSFEVLFWTVGKVEWLSNCSK